MQSPKNLIVTERSLSLARETFRVTGHFPREERFGLVSQMRRASVSIGSNIAEGCGRGGDREFASFLHIALGSATELEFQIALVKSMDWVAPEMLAPLESLVTEVRRMLARLILVVRARSRKANPA